MRFHLAIILYVRLLLLLLLLLLFCLWRVEQFICLSGLTTNVDQMIDLRLFTKFLQLSIKLEAAYIVNLSSYSEV